MTKSPSSQTKTIVDWEACENVAERLGVHTRNLVAARDPAALQAWALTQELANTGPRAISYLELAVLAGHQPEGTEAATNLEWRALIEKFTRLLAAIKAKAEAEANADTGNVHRLPTPKETDPTVEPEHAG